MWPDPVQRFVEAFGFGLLVRRRSRVWYNQALAEIIERPVGAIQTIDQWFPTVFGANAEAVRARYEARRGSNLASPSVLSFIVPSGGVRHLSITSSRLGPIEIWVVADVTEQRSAEERYTALFEYSSDPHFLFARGGVRDCNQAALDLLGFERKEEFLNAHPAVFSPEVQPCGTPSAVKARQVDEVARRTGFNRFHWVHKRCNGELVPVEVSLTQVHLADGPALLGVWHDLSEREAREAQLRRARDDAEAGLASRSVFIATMSHELRTPMNGVLGLTEALLETPLTDEQRKLARAVLDSGTTLRRLLDDVLDFSKVEAGKLQLECVPFRVSEVLNAVVALHGEAAGAKQVELRLDPPSDDPQVCGDPTRITQILGNLVSNGIKFTERGSVLLETERLDGRLRVRVRDTGIGMSPDDQVRVFEAFRQADGGTTRRFGGTGLGLAIVERLVAAMEGSIRVESTPGEGSCFEVCIPLPLANEAECPGVGRRSVVPAMAGDTRILVAEDNAINRLVVERALQGVQTRFVEDGSQVEAAVAEFRPHLILMDVHMPIMDGLEATRRLRAAAIGLPIVALTASCLEEDTQACVEAGMDHVLHKPLDRTALHRAIVDFTAEARRTRP